MRNITGIVAEYNPFHKGHAYHMEQARIRTNADAIIIVMSGDFVQRGACAIADKYTRAQAALACGADLVLELPALYACASAEYFAGGAVTLLEKTGIVSHIAFGCEDDDIELFQQAARYLADEPPEYRLSLQKHLACGCSFPKARELALCESHPKLLPLLSRPNNILGTEYCKRLQSLSSNIHPVAIRRLGSDYHTIQEDILFSSAASIRTQIKQFEDDRLLQDKISGIHSSCPDEILSTQLPETSYKLLKNEYKRNFPLFDEALSSYVHFALLNVPDKQYSAYLDVSEELSSRIRKHLPEYHSFHQFVTLLKTKELTYSRICRCLIHILLNVQKTVYEPLLKQYAIPYIRVLGMRKDASPLLGQIHKCTNLPIITNISNYSSGKKTLSKEGELLFQTDCHASCIRNSAAMDKFKQKLPVESSRKFLKI